MANIRTELKLLYDIAEGGSLELFSKIQDLYLKF